MQSGYVQLRRGIIEHLLDGRLTANEYTVYSLVILQANHRTGAWLGCAAGIARLTKWSTRQCRYLLKSLKTKGYVEFTPSIGRGRYLIQVSKYFAQKGNPHSPSAQEGESPFPFTPRKGNPHSPYQEEEVNLKNKAAQPRRVPSHRSEFEQRRILNAQALRLQAEEQIRREAMIGAGPIVVGSPFKPEYLEKIRARQTGKNSL